MTSFIVALLLLALASAGMAVRKTYFQLPLTELRRRAAKRQKEAARLYRAVSYGSSLQAVLWVWITLTSAGSFVLLARSAPVWLSLIAVAVILGVAYAWLPSSRISKLSRQLTLAVTPVIAGLLGYVDPFLSRLTSWLGRRHAIAIHTGVYERTDLERLLERQQHQGDNRLSDEELQILRHVLKFPDYYVRDVLTARADVHTVLASDTLGPILINELHQSGQEYVLVRETADTTSPIIGTLAVHELGLKSKGTVADVMNATVYYLHEGDSLSEALHAFFVTNHPLFVVTNSFEEYVGVMTIQNVLHQLLGHIPGNHFDQYADLQAVATRHQVAHGVDDLDGSTVEVLE